MSTSDGLQKSYALVHDPATWVNSAFPIYVVQGLPLDKAFHVGHGQYRPDIWRGPCSEQKPHVESRVAEVIDRWHRDHGEPITPQERKELSTLMWYAKQAATEDHPCPGMPHEHRARRGLRLPREQALHLVNAHFRHPNMSVTRYSSPALVSGATDLIFEVDFHKKDDLYGIADHVPLIEAAVRVGRRLYDCLVGQLAVDERYITTTITRQGCRVTVDWRAFGPRRVHELLVVMRWIESQVFAAGEIASMGATLGTYMSEVDSGIYGDKYDLKVNEHGINEKVAHWLRPIGALHSKSSQAWGFARATPVPHDVFRPENAEQLTWMSRGSTAHIGRWKYPDVWKQALRWPEARDPRYDYLIENSPSPATRIIELFDRGMPNLIEKVREDLRSGLRARVHAYTPRPRPSGDFQEVSRDLLRDIVERVNPGARVRDVENGIRFKCPRAACQGKSGEDALLFDGNGAFYCHRCKRLSFVEFCAEVGCTAMIPPRANSTGGPILISREHVGPNYFAEGWPEFTERYVVTVDNLEQSREFTRNQIRHFLNSPDHRVLFLAGSTGTGKTTTLTKEVNDRGLVTRSYAARNELKETLAEHLHKPKIVHGREYGENCWHEGLEDAYALRESISKTLCPTCPHRRQCEQSGYLSQFSSERHEGSLILHHNHATVDDLDRFSNESTVDFVDEDPLGSIIDSIDLDAEVLERFCTALVHDFEGAEQNEHDLIQETLEELPASANVRVMSTLSDMLRKPTIGLGVKPKRAPSSSRAKVLVERLIACLDPDLVSQRSPAFAAGGVLSDLSLARHLFADDALREAVDLFDDEDERALYGGREFLLELSRVRVLRGDTWTREAQQALDLLVDGREITERQAKAFKDATQPPEGAFSSPPPESHEARPPDILGDLLAGLRHLQAQHVEGYSSPSPLQLIRTERSTWTLRLTRRRSFLKRSGKIIVATATAVPERMQLVFGTPGPTTRWMLVRADPPDPTEVTYIADRLYSKGSLSTSNKKDGKELLDRLLETVQALVKCEHERTQLPVAVVGVAELVNAFNERVLRRLPKELRMPLKGDRTRLAARLSELTMPHGYLSGYSYGTSGLNTFGVEHEAGTRFVRSIVLLGSPIPALQSVAADHRGLYAYHSDGTLYGPDLTAGAPSVDWTFTYRTVGFEGHPKSNDTQVVAARNVPGFRGERANAILCGMMEAEMIQSLGRMRGMIPDPVDPSIVPHAFVFSGIPMPGVRTARTASLEKLREALGLEAKMQQKRGPKQKLSPNEAIRANVKKHGRTKVVERLVRDMARELGSNIDFVTNVRVRFQDAGLPWDEQDQARVREAVRLLDTGDRR
jgi:hypothetical protein